MIKNINGSQEFRSVGHGYLTFFLDFTNEGPLVLLKMVQVIIDIHWQV